jgi:hypothetical protein
MAYIIGSLRINLNKRKIKFQQIHSRKERWPSLKCQRALSGKGMLE